MGGKFYYYIECGGYIQSLAPFYKFEGLRTQSYKKNAGVKKVFITVTKILSDDNDSILHSGCLLQLEEILLQRFPSLAHGQFVLSSPGE